MEDEYMTVEEFYEQKKLAGEIPEGCTLEVFRKAIEDTNSPFIRVPVH